VAVTGEVAVATEAAVTQESVAGLEPAVAVAPEIAVAEELVGGLEPAVAAEAATAGAWADGGACASVGRWSLVALGARLRHDAVEQAISTASKPNRICANIPSTSAAG
jgi:hypothetical protein